MVLQSGQTTTEITPEYRIALCKWPTDGGIGDSIAFELERLGHRIRRFLANEPVSPETDIIFTYAPYGRWLQIPQQMSRMPEYQRPFLVHWNTEGLPPPYVPLTLQKGLGILRSGLDELVSGFSKRAPNRPSRSLDGFLNYRMLRYRYLGDYLRLQRMGIDFLLVDISKLYQERFEKLGVACLNVPFGSSIRWHANLTLKREIDVLWIGSHGSRRRTRHLRRIHKALADRAIKMHMVDGREAPFVHGNERTELINRTKIALNLMRTPFDDNTLRMFLAMPNRALVVSEPMLKHNPQLQVGIHYVEAPLANIPDTIQYYLEHDDLRAAIVERAYQITTQDLPMSRMIRKIMRAVSKSIRSETYTR